MSAMVNLEIPWINVMSKMDLVTSNAEEPSGGARNGVRGRKNIARYVPLAPYDSIMSYALFLDTTIYLPLQLRSDVSFSIFISI
jgi:hypothetical protein